MGCDPGFGDPNLSEFCCTSFSLHGNGHDLHRVGLRGAMFRNLSLWAPNQVPVHMVSDEYCFVLLDPSFPPS